MLSKSYQKRKNLVQYTGCSVTWFAIQKSSFHLLFIGYNLAVWIISYVLSSYKDTQIPQLLTNSRTFQIPQSFTYPQIKTNSLSSGQKWLSPLINESTFFLYFSMNLIYFLSLNIPILILIYCIYFFKLNSVSIFQLVKEII